MLEPHICPLCSGAHTSIYEKVVASFTAYYNTSIEVLKTSTKDEHTTLKHLLWFFLSKRAGIIHADIAKDFSRTREGVTIAINKVQNWKYSQIEKIDAVISELCTDVITRTAA